jgi:hypothetical protein
MTLAGLQCYLHLRMSLAGGVALLATATQERGCKDLASVCFAACRQPAAAAAAAGWQGLAMVFPQCALQCALHLRWLWAGGVILLATAAQQCT